MSPENREATESEERLVRETMHAIVATVLAEVSEAAAKAADHLRMTETCPRRFDVFVESLRERAKQALAKAEGEVTPC